MTEEERVQGLGQALLQLTEVCQGIAKLGEAVADKVSKLESETASLEQRIAHLERELSRVKAGTPPF